ncbi:NXPE family member 3-like [Dunckerocampus dactyliophorus]|uniref:NXPE family member 3-like n=1 Tax=Dunckerocampus dactyliophorus TaxID=161453 RepID=UPI0024055DBC|nr:NXPE family member 3-like [Dunckerocampus dactyliophorus]
MSPNVWKYGLTVLALFGLIYLLFNISILENWNCHCNTVTVPPQLQSHIHSTLSGPVPTFHTSRTFYAHQGHKVSLEEELEERELLNSIAWPRPPSGSAPLALRNTSDPVHSLFSVPPSKNKEHWYVGDQLEVSIQMYDSKGQPKGYGGDFLLARLHSPKYRAGVAGVVLDHKNGLYSAQFPLLWEGSAQVEVIMVHSSEAVAVLQRLREERPDRLYYKSLYKLGLQSETTTCNMYLPPDRGSLCDYTDPLTGEPWYCYKPKTLNCSARINHDNGGFVEDIITNEEALLFQSGINVKAPIRASGSDTISVLPSRPERNSVKPDAVNLMTSGYYYEDSWRPLGAVAMRQFSSSAITQCLTNKEVHMYGDSTIRQWFEYLMNVLPGLKILNFLSEMPRKKGPFMAVDSKHNTLVTFRCHGPPISFTSMMVSQLRYIANELDGLSGGPKTVVAISIWAHFTTFPVEVYIRRLQHIRKAVVRLLNRAPGTLVIIRSANPRALKNRISLYHSDWFSHQLDAVLRAMFKGLDILLVDAWQMTVAHRLPHDIHPPPAIIKNTVDLILSYVCPSHMR